MFDYIFTLKFAIYFIAPAVAVYLVAILAAPALSLAAQIVIGREVMRDAAASMMAVVIVAGAGAAFFVNWVTGTPWVAVVVGATVVFLSGTVLYAKRLKAFAPKGRERLAPIGLQKAALISAIVTLPMFGIAVAGIFAIKYFA